MKFEVGDRVFLKSNGIGTVTRTSTGNPIYPLEVEFDNNAIEHFFSDGAYDLSGRIVLTKITEDKESGDQQSILNQHFTKELTTVNEVLYDIHQRLFDIIEILKNK